MLKKSIKDYALDSENVLLRDLIVDELHASKLAEAGGASATAELNDKEPSARSSIAASLEEIGWIISNCDEESTEASTSQEEFDRLQVLKMYSSVESNKDETLNGLTLMASNMLQHDYTWILLIDLRISWVVSSQGLGGMTECPRHLYFPCAHALRTQQPVLMVENLMEDDRFVKSPFANGPLGARFYAAAPLISPEGYRIGVFGVASTSPRTMTLAEQHILAGFADLTMRHLAERRKKLDLEERLKKAVACTSHDIMTPLMGLQLSLASLKDDKDLSGKLNDFQRELISTADNCVTTMCLLGKTAMQDVHEGLAEADGCADRSVLSRSSTEASSCQLGELIDRLHQTMDPIEKAVPLMINLDTEAPPTLAVPDLKVFRAAIALLCLACARTKSGYIVLRIRKEDGQIVFSCESSAPPLQETKVAAYMDPNLVHDNATLPCLRLAAKAIRSLHGICGYSCSEDQRSTSLWFKVPHLGAALPDTSSLVERFSDMDSIQDSTLCTSSSETESCLIDPVDSLTYGVKKRVRKSITLGSTVDDASRKKKVLVIDDSLVVRKSLQRALATKFGYHVTVAEDGREGLARLQESVYDFVLMDFLMPIMDGWDCTQQYRQWEAHHRPWFRQLIIGMSAHAGDKDVHRASQFGMDDYRCKPITIKTLSDLTQDLKIIQIQKQLDYLLPMFSADSEPLPKRRRGSLLCLSSDVIPRTISANMDMPSQVKPHSMPMDTGAPVCLVYRSSSADSSWSTVSTADSFQRHGWNIETVQSSDETLARLKQRNYDAVIVEEELAAGSAVSCVAAFREWESTNRVNRQKNVLLQFSTESALCKVMSHGGLAVVQPPAGYDGVIGADAAWDDFQGVVGPDASTPHDRAQMMGIVLR